MKSSLYLLIAATFLFTSCASNNVTVDDSLARYFDSAGVKGDFALLDNGQGRFTIYNLPRYRDSLYPPGATFDILQSLIALQTGVLKDDNATIEHDPRDTTDKTTNPIKLRDAFQNNTLVNVVAFIGLAREIGIDTLKKWVDSLHYGNMHLSGRLDSLGSGDSLKITADEQLGLTKKLYFNQLPFYRRPQELVRDMFSKETNSNYQLAYKTARIDYADHTMGWIMGWVEENKHPYFFVLNIETPDKNGDISTIGLQLVKRILVSEGFFQGKK